MPCKPHALSPLATRPFTQFIQRNKNRMANPRASTAPLRPLHAPASRELIAAKRREYLALCEIAQDSGQLEKNLRATAGQQALMKEGGAGTAFPVLRSVHGN
jgi:hypothetical protein